MNEGIEIPDRDGLASAEELSSRHRTMEARNLDHLDWFDVLDRYNETIRINAH